MTLSLSVPAFWGQYSDSALQKQTLQQPWKIPLVDKAGQSHGYRQEVNLRPGLNVLVDDYTLAEDLVVETGSGDACIPALSLELSFMLSGHNRLEGVQNQHNFLAAYCEEQDGGQFRWQGGERILKFDVHIEAHLFESLLGKPIESLPTDFSQITRSVDSAASLTDSSTHLCFLHIAATTTAMRSVIQQLLSCPYEGPTRWLYWEGKVLELIALRLGQLSEGQRKTRSALQADDVERIYYARDILIQRLTHPPSLLELSRLVGLNDYKLKKGFQQVLETTVFGYLSQQRMKKARRLLADQQSISAVAIAVGYTSPTAFSTAFKRQFGVSPKRYQLGKYKIVC